MIVFMVTMAPTAEHIRKQRIREASGARDRVEDLLDAAQLGRFEENPLSKKPRWRAGSGPPSSALRPRAHPACPAPTPGAQAFIAAPRAFTRAANLGGRVFLHSYDPALDPEAKTLELILTAPVVVASWIALHYFGVTAAPAQFGSGNKLLHNVAGGLGVFEGRRPMLRTGLPRQAISDGCAAQHMPVALAVYLEASETVVLDILHRHPEVRALFDNGWLSLSLLASGQVVARYKAGRFSSRASSKAKAA